MTDPENLADSWRDDRAARQLHDLCAPIGAVEREVAIIIACRRDVEERARQTAPPIRPRSAPAAELSEEQALAEHLARIEAAREGQRPVEHSYRGFSRQG